MAPPKFPLRTIAKRRGVLPFERGERPRDHIWASELGKCARAVWFEWNYPTVWDARFSETRGALGHAVEQVIASHIRPVIVAEEVSFTSDLVSGRVDFVIRTKHAGPMIPVEVKSTYAFTKFLSAPLRSHVLQLQYYLSQIPEAPFGLLVYYNLSNWGGGSGEWEAIRIEREDEAMWKRAEQLWYMVRRKAPPKCENEGADEDCFDCSVSPEAKLNEQAKQRIRG